MSSLKGKIKDSIVMSVQDDYEQMYQVGKGTWWGWLIGWKHDELVL